MAMRSSDRIHEGMDVLDVYGDLIGRVEEVSRDDAHSGPGVGVSVHLPP